MRAVIASLRSYLPTFGSCRRSPSLSVVSLDRGYQPNPSATWALRSWGLRRRPWHNCSSSASLALLVLITVAKTTTVAFVRRRHRPVSLPCQCRRWRAPRAAVCRISRPFGVVVAISVSVVASRGRPTLSGTRRFCVIIFRR